MVHTLVGVAGPMHGTIVCEPELKIKLGNKLIAGTMRCDPPASVVSSSRGCELLCATQCTASTPSPKHDRE